MLMQVLGVKHPRWSLSEFDLLGTVVGLSLKMQVFGGAARGRLAYR
jgi:hypothetical protein